MYDIHIGLSEIGLTDVSGYGDERLVMMPTAKSPVFQVTATVPTLWFAKDLVYNVSSTLGDYAEAVEADKQLLTNAEATMDAKDAIIRTLQERVSDLESTLRLKEG